MMPDQPVLMTVTIDKLVVSPLNVRTNQEDAEATGALEASIEARGLLLPLVVHPVMRAGGDAIENVAVEFGVLAGGRRLRALQRLVAGGRIPADTPIAIVVRDLEPAEITEVSLAENLLRRELRPYEVHAAIARASEQGATIEEIAANIGQREQWVKQQLRLGGLAPEIFHAYAEGKIAAEEAQAYGATEDQDLQRAAWKHFNAQQEWYRTPRHIRAWLKVGDRELERLLRYVGDDLYRSAGGRFELDLFADGPDRGRVVDEGTLRELAEDKLAQLRTDLRRRAARPDLRFTSEAPQLHGSADRTLSFEPIKRGKGADQSIELPEGEVVALIEISDNGEANVSWWWASRKAKREAERGGKVDRPSVPITSAGVKIDDAVAFDATANFSYAQAARAAVKDEHGLTADGLQVVRSLRRELLRAILVANAIGPEDSDGGTLGRDYAVWAQLRQELGDERAPAVGARGLASLWHGAEDAEPADIVRPHLDETRAHALWTTAVEEVRRHPAFALKDPDDAFTAFFLSPERLKRLAGGILAGLALLRSANTPGWRVATHNRLADLAGADDATLRELWKPNANFMALFPKMKRLELAQPYVEPASFRDWHKQSDVVLTGATAGAVEQDPCWVHPLLSFGVLPEQDHEFGGMSSRAAGEASDRSPPKPNADQREAAE
jgi:ParB family chromosome partitioning protein